MARVRILTPEQAVEMFGTGGGGSVDGAVVRVVWNGTEYPLTRDSALNYEFVGGPPPADLADHPGDSWIGPSAGAINPTMFGGVGDYDPATGTGTDDTVAIQAALSSAATTGLPVDLLARHWRISDTLVVPNCPGFTVTAGRSGISGSITNAHGAWLHYTGSLRVPMVQVHNSQSVTWERAGLHANNVADGLLVTSDNAPVTKDITASELTIHRPLVGVTINDSGTSTQTDQIEVRSVRVTEAVEAGFRTDSDNTTNVLFQRCSSTMAGSLTDQVHFDFRRGAILKLDNCSGGHGQDFVRLGVPVNAVVVDTSQFEGSTHADRAFLRTADTLTGNTSPITLRNCVPDNPVIIGQQSRRLLTQGCLWHAGSGGSVVLSGDNTYWLSQQDTIDPSAPITVTGVNARVQRHGVFTFGVPTTGTYVEGEYLPEHSPLINGATGYTCVASGAPGTWVTHPLPA